MVCVQANAGNRPGKILVVDRFIYTNSQPKNCKIILSVIKDNRKGIACLKTATSEWKNRRMISYHKKMKTIRKTWKIEHFFDDLTLEAGDIVITSKGPMMFARRSGTKISRRNFIILKTLPRIKPYRQN